MGNNIIVQSIEQIATALSSYEDDKKLLKKIETENIKYNIIAFFSPYANVGQTTAVTNIAYLLSLKGYSVCVVDMDVIKPDVFRYLHDTNSVKRASPIKEKLNSSQFPVQEITHISRFPNVSYISADFTEHISSNCALDNSQSTQQFANITAMISELSSLYDFVLIDTPEKITEVETMAALTCADTVFTMVDGTERCFEYLIKLNKTFDGIGMSEIFKDVIQAKTRTVAFTSEEFTRIYGKPLLMTIPHSDSVSILSYSGEIFCDKAEKSVAYTASSAKVRMCYDKLAEIVVERSKIESDIDNSSISEIKNSGYKLKETSIGDTDISVESKNKNKGDKTWN